MKFFYTIIVCCATQCLQAQGLGLEVFGGVVNYQGDLRQEVYTFQGVRMGAGVGITYDLNKRFQARAMLMSGSISADDKNNKDPRLYYRNLNFRTNITEVSLQLLFHLLNNESAPINPYAIGGIALFRFNPFTQDQSGQKYFLQPLGTEGQGLPSYPEPLYKLNQLSLPVGGGIAFRINEQVTLAWEICFRMTLTDYIDDVSTVYADEFDLLIGRGPKSLELAFRGWELPGVNPIFPTGYPSGFIRGNPNANDWYYFSGIKANIRLKTPERSGSSKWKKSKGSTSCPKW